MITEPLLDIKKQLLFNSQEQTRLRNQVKAVKSSILRHMESWIKDQDEPVRKSLRSRARTDWIVDYRHAISLFLSSFFTDGEIGKFLERDRTTILHLRSSRPITDRVMTILSSIQNHFKQYA